MLDVGLNPGLHLVPPVDTILASLHDLVTVCAEIIVRDQRQHLAPGLLATQDVLVNETQLLKELLHNLESSLYTGVLRSLQQDLLSFVFSTRHELRRKRI